MKELLINAPIQINITESGNPRTTKISSMNKLIIIVVILFSFKL
jgi:hypothetical protein